ncbi:MAG: hypothetical protein IJH57_04875 [Mogibacterium sp.]|nr:hypothetical protein [Mogibacterium sp.]
MDFGKYTERQLEIIEGRVPLYLVEEIEVRRLYVKAQYVFDRDTTIFAETELKRRNIRVVDRSKDYSSKQKDIIEGRIAMEDCEKTELATLFHKARYFGDRDLGERIKAELKSRDNWICAIDGYNTIQTAIIEGLSDITSIHNNALRGLRRVALFLGDLDIVEWLDEEYEKRALKPSEAEKVQLEDIEFMVQQSLYGKMKDFELNYAFHLYRRKGNVETLIELGKEIARRSYYVRRQKYDDNEKSIINGEKDLSQVHSYWLEHLKDKLLLDDSKDYSELIAEIISELDQREAARMAKIDSKKNDYTDRQRKLLEGNIPLYKENTSQLKVILRKAEKRGEIEKAAFIEKEIRAREAKLESGQPYSDIQQMLINSIKNHTSPKSLPEEPDVSIDGPEFGRYAEDYGVYRIHESLLCSQVSYLRDEEYEQSLCEQKKARPYTRRQRLILEGIISIDDVRDYEISKLIEKARDLGDEYYASMLEDAREEKVCSANNISVDGTSIARGEIPYEAVSVYQLRRLGETAKAAGDMQLYELTQTLIIEKQIDCDERNKVRAKNPFYRKGNMTPPGSRSPAKTKEWAIDILESRVYPTLCTMMDLQDIRLLAVTMDNPAYAEVARFLINERKERSIVYTAQTKEQAISVIDCHTWYPVAWP